MSLDELIKKTERVVETGFLWLRILKALKREPTTMSELRRRISPIPHMYTFQMNLYLMERLGLVRREGRGYSKTWYITEKGCQVLERATKHLKEQMELLLGG
jgi:DNA-binding HxlR family transcriptional regulator